MFLLKKQYRTDCGHQQVETQRYHGYGNNTGAENCQQGRIRRTSAKADRGVEKGNHTENNCQYSD